MNLWVASSKSSCVGARQSKKNMERNRSRDSVRMRHMEEMAGGTARSYLWLENRIT